MIPAAYVGSVCVMSTPSAPFQSLDCFLEIIVRIAHPTPFSSSLACVFVILYPGTTPTRRIEAISKSFPSPRLNWNFLGNRLTDDEELTEETLAAFVASWDAGQLETTEFKLPERAEGEEEAGESTMD